VQPATWGSVRLCSPPPVFVDLSPSNNQIEKYNQALADCHFILDRMAPPPQKSSPLNPLLQKVHYRIAQAYYHLQQYSSALEHLDQFIWLGGLREKGSELRMRVLNDQVHQDWAPPPVIPSEVLPGGSKLRITLKPMNYIQRAVMVRGETVTSIEYEEAVPIEFCELPPPKGGKKFLEELIMAHHEDFMALRAWKCFNCAKPAASSLHSALSYLHLEPAQVVDYMLPICKDCDKVGKEFLLVEMAAVQGYRKGLTH